MSSDDSVLFYIMRGNVGRMDPTFSPWIAMCPCYLRKDAWHFVILLFPIFWVEVVTCYALAGLNLLHKDWEHGIDNTVQLYILNIFPFV